MSLAGQSIYSSAYSRRDPMEINDTGFLWVGFPSSQQENSVEAQTIRLYLNSYLLPETELLRRHMA